MNEENIDGDTSRPSESGKESTNESATVDLRSAQRALTRVRTSGASAGGAPSRATSRKKSTQGKGSGKDPQLIGEAIEEFLGEQGWDDHAAIARLGEMWADIVGPEVADHVQIESWSEGTLVVRADSTAWATQVRLLTGTLLDQVRSAIGPGLISTVHVKGPSAPSWRAGPRVVKGRGPRDTYG